MRISDWSSDVCSSDLHAVGDAVLGELERVRGEREPMVAMAQGFGVAFLRVELARHGEALSRRFVEGNAIAGRSEEHTSELQSLMRISYAVFCLKKQKNQQRTTN